MDDQLPGLPEASFARTRHHIVRVGRMLVAGGAKAPVCNILASHWSPDKFMDFRRCLRTEILAKTLRLLQFWGRET